MKKIVHQVGFIYNITKKERKKERKKNKIYIPIPTAQFSLTITWLRVV